MESLINDVIQNSNLETRVKTFRMLKKNFDIIKKKLILNNINTLNIEELRNLLAYKVWKNGEDFNVIDLIVNSNDAFFKNKKYLLENLKKFSS